MTISVEEATVPLFNKARRTLFNIAPERADSLAHEVFGSGNWTINTVQGKANFAAVVDDKEILCSFAGLASLWCLSYAAFHIMDIGSRALRATENKGLTEVDIAEKLAELNLSTYIDFASALFSTNYADWKHGLALPNANAVPASADGRINNVFFGALSWFLLHEVGHVDHGHVKAVPSGQKIFLEHQADDFATTWILMRRGADCKGNFAS